MCAFRVGWVVKDKAGAWWEIDNDAALALLRDLAHERAIANAVEVETLKPDLFSAQSFGMARLNKVAGVNWNKVDSYKRDLVAREAAEFGRIAREDPPAAAVRLILAAAATAHMKMSAEKVYREVASHNEKVGAAAQAAVDFLTPVRDSAMTTLGLLAVPLTGGAAVAAGVICVVGTGQGKYVDTDGDVQRAAIAGFGAILTLGVGRVMLPAARGGAALAKAGGPGVQVVIGAAVGALPGGGIDVIDALLEQDPGKRNATLKATALKTGMDLALAMAAGPVVSRLLDGVKVGFPGRRIAIGPLVPSQTVGDLLFNIPTAILSKEISRYAENQWGATPDPAGTPGAQAARSKVAMSAILRTALADITISTALQRGGIIDFARVLSCFRLARV
jgi:hypothetical protein